MIKKIQSAKELNMWVLQTKDIWNFRLTHQDMAFAIYKKELPLFSLEFNFKLVYWYDIQKDTFSDEIWLITTRDSFWRYSGPDYCVHITEDELNEINNIWNGFYEGEY